MIAVMAKEVDYSAYSEQKRKQVLALVYAEFGLSAITGWVNFQTQNGKLGLHFADELGFWLAQTRGLVPVEAGAEDTGDGFRAWATLISPALVSATAEVKLKKTNKRVNVLRQEMGKAGFDGVEQMALGGDWISVELQRGVSAAMAGAVNEEVGALTAALARILDGAQKKGEARTLVLDLLPNQEGLEARLDKSKSREEFRELASQYVAALTTRLRGSEREQAIRALLLAVTKTIEDLDVRALALDRAKARAAIDLCQGRIIKGNKAAVKPTEVVALTKPAIKPAEVVAVTKPAAKPIETTKPVVRAKVSDESQAALPAGKSEEVAKKELLAEVTPRALAARPEEKVAKEVSVKEEAAPLVAAAKTEVQAEVQESSKQANEAKPAVGKPGRVKAGPSNAGGPRATAKQQAYIKDLMRKAGVKKENTEKRMEKLVGSVKRIEDLTASEAAQAIDKLLVVLKKKEGKD